MADKKSYSFALSYPNTGLQRMLHDMGHSVVSHHSQAQVALFPGGSDVIPLLYGERALPRTSFIMHRDLREAKFYRELPRSMPKVGICRGAQFLCVMGGGSLWQDVDGHATGSHDIMDVKSKRVLQVTSTHHQMMIPPSHAKVLAVAAEARRKESEKGIWKSNSETPALTDIEVIFLKDEKILAFQPHPEYSHPSTAKYFWELMDTYIFNRVQF